MIAFYTKIGILTSSDSYVILVSVQVLTLLQELPRTLLQKC